MPRKSNRRAPQGLVYDRKVIQKIKKEVIKIDSCWAPIDLHKNHCETLIPTFKDGFMESYNFCKVCSIYAHHTLDDLKQLIPFFPTDKDCKQLVIGPIELLAPYLSYLSKDPDAPFFISTAKNWTVDLNKILLTCGMLMNLQNARCEYPVRILLPKNIEDLYRDDMKPRITLLELCIVLKYLHNFEVYKVNGLDYDLILLGKK
jgi:hypothetical protein